MPLSDPHSIITLVAFVGVILAIAFDLIDMVLAALLGVCTLTVSGIFHHDDVMAAIGSCQEPLALLFGGMVVARTLEPTGIFENIGTRFLILTRGSGRRFLLGIIFLVAPICAFLPNATTVILVAPIIIRTAIALEVDFVGPMILTAIISNSAGLLTLVGDPATFLVGSSIGLTFLQYLQRISLGGLLSVLIIIVLLPRVLGDVWRVRRVLPAGLAPGPIQRPAMCALSLSVLMIMLLLFVFGDFLPVRLVPPAVAIIAATLALLVIYAQKIEPVGAVLKDVDWKTLIFIGCMFFMVQALTKTELIEDMTHFANVFFGNNLMGVGFSLLAAIALLSSLLANIPVVAATILIVKGYFVVIEMVPEEALGAGFMDWPPAALPVFVAMMFGATLGGNATLIGAAANIVAAGICASHGKPVGFAKYLRYGVPITAAQLAISALYVLGLFFLVGSMQ
jgi:Na+/H+ antiporter NhaD/arsenite permease-like protein